VITECLVENRVRFGPRAGPEDRAGPTPRQSSDAMSVATASLAGAQEDGSTTALPPPQGTGGDVPCDRGAPAIWLLPCILGGGLIWAAILLAVL